MPEFNHGPFALAPGERFAHNGQPARRWAMHYGAQHLGEHVLPADANRAAIIDAFAEDRAAFVRSKQAAHAPGRLELIDSTTGDAVAAFSSYSYCGMTPGLIDDRSRFWLCSADRLYSRNVSLTEFGRIVAENRAAALAWIARILPDAVLEEDPSSWRSPTSWELRHVVGEGSFTGVTGAAAAEIVGVTPQNFRKYMAREGASTRQPMGYAMWHLLLHKLGVQDA